MSSGAGLARHFRRRDGGESSAPARAIPRPAASTPTLRHRRLV